MTPTYALFALLSRRLFPSLALTIPGSSPDWILFEGERKLVPLSASGNTTFCPAGVQDGDGLSLGESTIAQLRFNGTSLVVRDGEGRGKVTADDGRYGSRTTRARCTGLDPNVTHVLAVSGLDRETTRECVIAAVQIDGKALPPENVALEMRPVPLAAVFFAALVITLLV